MGSVPFHPFLPAAPAVPDAVRSHRRVRHGCNPGKKWTARTTGCNGALQPACLRPGGLSCAWAFVGHSGPQWATVGVAGVRGVPRRAQRAGEALDEGRPRQRAHPRTRLGWAGAAARKARPGRDAPLNRIVGHLCVCMCSSISAPMSRSLSMGIHACSPEPSGPSLSHTAHSSVAVSPGWRRCRCGVSPFESSRATAH